MAMDKQRKMCYGLLLALLLVALTAGGASPLATQVVHVGPYSLLLSFYSLPRVDQDLNMTIESANSTMQLQFTQATLNPAPGTDGNVVKVQLTPDSDQGGVYDVTTRPTVRGTWLLHLIVSGNAGSYVGNIPLTVQGPPTIPTWLGWAIGLVPLPFLIAFLWLQIRHYYDRQKRIRAAGL
jgi:hypothetical protein